MANALGSVVIEMAVNLARLRSDFGTAAQISQTRLREIERNAARTVREISNVGRAVQSAFGALGIGIGLTAIAASLKNSAAAAIQFGDAMQKAAAKTGIAASTFSELAYAAQLNDVTLEALSTAFKTLQTRVSEAGSGVKSAQTTFRALGIEFEQFRKTAPDQQFEAIADAISRLEDPADRTRAAVELFGRSGAELLPLFEKGAAGIRVLREEAIRTGRALTEDQINKLADADQSIKQLTASWENFSRTLTASVAPALSTVLDSLSGADVDLQDNVRRGQIEALLKSRGPSVDWYLDTPDLRRELAQIQERERRRLLGPGRQATRNLSPITRPPGFAATADEGAGGGKAADPMAGLSDIRIWQREVFNLRNEMNGWMDEFNTDFTNNFTEEVNGTVNGIRKMSVVIEENRQALDQWSAFAEEAAAGIQSAFADFLFDPFREGLRGMLGDFVDVIRRMIAEWLALQLLTGIGTSLGGSSNKYISSFGDFLAGKRAMGGPVTAGGAYLVGERGPEIFMPRSSGTIIPNGSGGLNFAPVYQIDARGADADRIMAILPPLLKQSEQRTISELYRLQRQGRFA